MCYRLANVFFSLYLVEIASKYDLVKLNLTFKLEVKRNHSNQPDPTNLNQATRPK